MSEFDSGWIEDEICENCRWWSVEYKECYADDPGNGHCFESKYADTLEEQYARCPLKEVQE